MGELNVIMPASEYINMSKKADRIDYNDEVQALCNVAKEYGYSGKGNTQRFVKDLAAMRVISEEQRDTVLENIETRNKGIHEKKDVPSKQIEEIATIKKNITDVLEKGIEVKLGE